MNDFPDYNEQIHDPLLDSEGVMRGYKLKPATVAPEVNTKLTRVKFKQRMTQTERIAVRTAGKTDDIVFDFMDLVSEATYIDLSLPETIQGVQYLEANGHLAVGRADEILNTPVTADEAYHV